MTWFTRWRARRRTAPLISARYAYTTLLAAIAPMVIAAAVATIILTTTYNEVLGFGVLLLSTTARVLRDLTVILILVAVLRWFQWLAFHRASPRGRKAGYPAATILMSYLSWYVSTRLLGTGLDASLSIILLILVPMMLLTITRWQMQRSGGFIVPDTASDHAAEHESAGTAHP